MALSTDLISQFVKITNDKPKEKKETTVYGTTVEHNGSLYVKMDGSEILTPVTTTTDMKAGERVTVIKPTESYTATVTDITDKCELVLKLDDGEVEILSTGEVSVRMV